MSGNVRSDGLHVCISMCKGICIGIDMCLYMRMCVCICTRRCLVLSCLVLSCVTLVACFVFLCCVVSCVRRCLASFFCFQWWLVSYRFVRTGSHLSGRPFLFLRYLGSLSESDGFGILLCGFLCVCVVRNNFTFIGSSLLVLGNSL